MQAVVVSSTAAAVVLLGPPHSAGMEVLVLLSDVLLPAVCVAGHQAVPGRDHEVDQSAWSVSAVQGAGRQVPHGTQV